MNRVLVIRGNSEAIRPKEPMRQFELLVMLQNFLLSYPATLFCSCMPQRLIPHAAPGHTGHLESQIIYTEEVFVYGICKRMNG